MYNESREDRANRLISLAREFRQNASDTQIAFYIDLMTRAARDLEELARSTKDGVRAADDLKPAATR